MKRFTKEITALLLLILVFNSISPIRGLINLHKDYQQPSLNAVKLLSSPYSHKRKAIIIGCSNLQYNIDYIKVIQNFNIDIDFLYFSASQNSTFLQYLNDEKLFEKYDDIFLYVPYGVLKKSNFLTETKSTYNYLGCYPLSVNVIKHNPLSFFYNWQHMYDSIHFYRRKPLPFHIDSMNTYLDSLVDYPDAYLHCNEKFIHSKHTIDIPGFSMTDIKFINSIKTPNQRLFILFTPIPNIIENIEGLSHLTDVDKIFYPLTLLNKPFIMDSSYFYNQWYHLNYCGKQIETENMISNLKKVYYSRSDTN